MSNELIIFYPLYPLFPHATLLNGGNPRTQVAPLPTLLASLRISIERENC